MKLAKHVAKRSICLRHAIGAVLVRNKRIVFEKPYPDEYAESLLKEAGVKLERWRPKKKKRQ